MFLILTLGILSVLLALVLTPIVRDHLGKFGFLDHPDGVRKTHVSAVPRVGGIAIVLAYVGTFAIAFALPFSYTYVLHRALPSILRLALAGSVIFAIGVLDDRLQLSARKKLIGIVGGAVLAYTAGIRVDIHILHGTRNIFNQYPKCPWPCKTEFWVRLQFHLCQLYRITTFAV